MDISPRRALDDYEGARADNPGSHKLVWALVVLVLMAAALVWRTRRGQGAES
jgi:hypothetical protein